MTKVLSEPIKDLEPTTREDFLTHKEQWLAGPILDRLEEELPPDAYCVLGVTTYDIYPKEDWSFVFGLARLKGRVGVYSLARYDPKFFSQPRPLDWEKKALERSLKVL